MISLLKNQNTTLCVWTDVWVAVSGVLLCCWLYCSVLSGVVLGALRGLVLGLGDIAQPTRVCLANMKI